MRPPNNQWPNTDGARGVLLFAQLFREMLEDATFESSRAYSLETPARLAEARALIKEVISERIPKQTLEPVIQELNWSISRDPIVAEYASELIDTFAKHISSANYNHQLQIITLLEKRIISNYRSHLEVTITDCFSDQKHRIKLRKTTEFYVSHLLNIGFSKDYLLSLVEGTFFQNDIIRTGRRSLNAFFRNFDSENRSFVVYLAISPQFGGHLKQLGYATFPARTRLHEFVKNCFENDDYYEGYNNFVSQTVKARDEYKAVDLAIEKISSVIAVAQLANANIDLDWHK